MSIKILVIGFQRSGTTLLRRIIHFHPEISHCFHEQSILNKNNFKQYENNNWGEKIPWYGNPNKIIKYTNRWLDTFDIDARVLHIIRNSEDVAISNVKFKSLNKQKSKDKCEESVAKVKEIFLNNKKYKEILFEDLVTNTFDIVTDIFKFCNLDCSKKTITSLISPDKKKWRYFDNINPNRALAHKNIK